MTKVKSNPGISYRNNESVGNVLIYPGLFTNSECQQITCMRKKLPKMDGTAGARSEVNTYRRDSKIRWVSLTPETEWIFKKVHTIVLEANQHYQFDLTGFRERFQLAGYTGRGHFDWHSDLGGGETSTRKLSVSVQLSDHTNYEGGDLEFFGKQELVLSKAVGTVIVFPSFLIHRVTPVTRGTRRSLVAWVHGPTFR